MQFLTTLIAITVAIGSANAACSLGGGTDPNCCWGGKDGQDACGRQGACNVAPDKYNYCSYFGITPQECDADCCDTRTRKGKPCPKGRNFCDLETGCPF